GQGSGMGASGGDFTTNGQGVAATAMDGPVHIGFDTNNNVFIADTANNRVLEFDQPLAAPTPNVTANRVYGQGSTGNVFNTSAPGVGQVGMDHPFGVALDPNNNLYVGDEANNRVVEIDTPLTNFTIGRVFGQGAANNYDGNDGDIGQ